MTYKKDLQTITNYFNYNDIQFDDVIKSKYDFTCVIDSLCKNKFISNKTFNNSYLSINKKLKKAYILCGSYKVRLEA